MAKLTWREELRDKVEKLHQERKLIERANKAVDRYKRAKACKT